MHACRRCARLLLACCALALGTTRAAADVPAWLPRYDLTIDLRVEEHVAHVRQRVTWINRHARPSDQLVFNNHAAYTIPKGDVGLVAKTLEILRTSASEGIDFGGPPCQIERITLVGDKDAPGAELAFHYLPDPSTALVVPLPRRVAQNEAVTVEITFSFRLPQKQGRWGQWKGVTYLSHWLPVLAVHDESGWQPVPFVPWHQPFFNEAGLYHAVVTLPYDQKIACTGAVTASTDLGDGRKRVEIVTGPARDFSFLCSAKYAEFTGASEAGPGVKAVKVRCLALPEHEHHARNMVKIVCEAIPSYQRWIGPYPYEEFLLVESHFAWNGNECSGLVMIDERVFAMPHLAYGYLEYLIAHELCHQWWYNVIGTNGYCETWMDEGFATFFTHRLLDGRHGTKNNKMLSYPRGLGWLPNIHRQTYRMYSLYGTLGRGEATPIVQEMPKFGHIVNLFSMNYDKGSLVVGLIEQRLGEAAFLDFIRMIYAKYQFRILRVADFRRELEAYTGRSWQEFFDEWLYSKGMSDWSVESVKVEQDAWRRKLNHPTLPRYTHPELWECLAKGTRTYATIVLHQKAEIHEPTMLGIRLGDQAHYDLRIPVDPNAADIELDEPRVRTESLPHGRVRVVVELPSKPTQITVDPDRLIPDRDPTNNTWKQEVNFRFAPLYTFLEETDITTSWDRWNVIVGPWLHGAAYPDPWYTRTWMGGARAGLYRTRHFAGGLYGVYRMDYRDFVVGADALFTDWPHSRVQLGGNFEYRVGTGFEADANPSRAALFGRYVFQYGSSLYLPPMHYAEVFASHTENFLPFARHTVPGAERFDAISTGGIHYHINYLTPYWDPEGGFQLDATYAGGVVNFDETTDLHQVSGQLSYAQFLPEWTGKLSETKLAARLYGAAASPTRGQFFPLGGSTLFRGFDIAERQGSAVWLASLEWRVPLARRLTYDYCDHVVGLRNVYGAVFYDVGDVYLRGKSVAGVAHAVGAGLRLDVAWFSVIERTMLRLDVAKAVNWDSPWQLWFGVQHPF